MLLLGLFIGRRNADEGLRQVMLTADLSEG